MGKSERYDDMADYMVRATAANAQIRAFAITSRDMVEYARSVHGLSPVVTAALGRLMTGGVMMGSMLKDEKDMLTLQINGAGPVHGMTVTADSQGNVKGYAHNPVVILPANSQGKLDVGGALGVGVLSVIQDIGLKEPYVGQTILVTVEIAEDLTYYYATSEQTPSSVALGVLMNKDNTVKQAGGFILQLEITNKLETRFFCNCDKKRVEKALISIGREELKSMIDDNKPVEINCHFCNHNYTFSVQELEELMEKTIR